MEQPRTSAVKIGQAYATGKNLFDVWNDLWRRNTSRKAASWVTDSQIWGWLTQGWHPHSPFTTQIPQNKSFQTKSLDLADPTTKQHHCIPWLPTYMLWNDGNANQKMT